MKYILATQNDDRYEIEGITTSPANYVVEFEPIDVIDRQIVAIDEMGNAFEFVTSNKVTNEMPHAVGIVDVGRWDISAGEPRLEQLDTDEVTNKVRDALCKLDPDTKDVPWEQIPSLLLERKPQLNLDK